MAEVVTTGGAADQNTSNPAAGKKGLARALVVLVPYLWLLVLFLAPFLIVLKISFSTTAIAVPPYTPVFDLGAGIAGLLESIRQLNLDNYIWLTEDALYTAPICRACGSRWCQPGWLC